jgi:hypothetical protein
MPPIVCRQLDVDGAEVLFDAVATTSNSRSTGVVAWKAD